jgi:hypothetical protein
MAKLDSVKKLPKTPKGEKEKTYGASKSGIRMEGHQQKRSLPRGKPPRTASMWWSKSDLFPTLWIQMKKEKRS